MKGLFDVWQGVWWCTHAKLAPQTPHPLRIAPSGLLRNNEGESIEAGNLSAPLFSSATGVCGWCDHTIPLFRILGLASILAASGCFRGDQPGSSFPCWVVNDQHEGMARSGIRLGGGSYGLLLPLPHFLRSSFVHLSPTTPRNRVLTDGSTLL